MSPLVYFLINHNARISYYDKWMVCDKEKEDVVYTVYQKKYGAKTTTLYEGSYLSTAILFLEGKVE